MRITIMHWEKLRASYVQFVCQLRTCAQMGNNVPSEQNQILKSHLKPNLFNETDKDIKLTFKSFKKKIQNFCLVHLTARSQVLSFFLFF